MPDFTVIIDASFGEGKSIELDMRNRPGVVDLPVRTWSFPWGVVCVQNSRSYGYEPQLRDRSLVFVVGRPRVMGWRHEDCGAEGFASHVRKLVSCAPARELYEELTGLYVLGGCDDKSITLFTDRMGAYPVYVARSVDGTRCAIGTMPEIVAKHVGRQSDLDLVSIGEILTRNVATFPYTTRNGMREIDCGSCHQFEILRSGEVKHTANPIWVPREPNRWPTLFQSRRELKSALEFAVEDIIRGSERVAVTLSGGADSRTVLACVPKNRRALAITYTDHENNETVVARDIAAVAGVPHHLATRGPDFYVDLAVRESQLLGLERGFVNSHSFAARDCPSQLDFDLLLCGDRSDTLLKGYCSAWKLGYLLMRARKLEFSRRIFEMPLKMQESLYQHNFKELCCDVRREIDKRVERRLEEVASFRSRSASEWFGFYPLSRHPHMSYSLASQRLFPSDQPFLHSRVIECARDTHHYFKANDLLTAGVFNALCGELGRVSNANTGLPGNVSGFVQFISRRRQKLFGRVSGLGQQQSKPYSWYTNGSWVDYAELQRGSLAWRKLRERASGRANVLENLLIRNPLEFIKEYSRENGDGFNYTMIRLLCSLSMFDNCSNQGFESGRINE